MDDDARTTTYVIALRREARDRAPADWQERIRGIEGVRAGAQVSGARMQIDASPEAAARIEAEFGQFMRVEHLLPRSRL